MEEGVKLRGTTSDYTQKRFNGRTRRGLHGICLHPEAQKGNFSSASEPLSPAGVSLNGVFAAYGASSQPLTFRSIAEFFALVKLFGCAFGVLMLYSIKKGGAKWN